MIFIATKIIAGLHVLMYFGTSLVVCNNDIPFCRKRLKELREDEKDWSKRCLNGKGQNLDTPSCETEKEYNHERMCMYTKICFYKGPYAEPYLLIKSKSEIHAIDLTTLDTTVIIGGIAGRTMDIDTVDNKLYIADNNSISRVNLDDICVEVILQNVSVRDMAIDWLARRLFWTEYLENRIFVADLGDKKKSVFIKRTSYPSGIAFDATVKYLFWTEPIANFVRRISLTPFDMVMLANRNISKFIVDCTKKRVYWLENRTGVHRIFSTDYNGVDRKIIGNGSLNDYSLGVLGDSLYYLNNDLFHINEMNVFNGHISRKILVDNKTYYDDLVIVHSSIQPRERMEIANFTCNFESPNSCQWAQDYSDDFDWTRHQAYTESHATGPHTDHTNGSGSLTNKKQGPGSIRHRGGKCIHDGLLDTFNKPIEGQFLVTYEGCAKDWLEFQLWPNGTLMHTRHSMCVKPTNRMTDGVKVGVFSSCDVTDTWSWTAQGSLQYKKKMCLRPKTGGDEPRNGVELVLGLVCDERQNFFEFVPTSGWYLFIETSLPGKPNDKARLISPSTIETKSCLLFFYHMFGHDMAELRVYVKSGGKMDFVWSLSGNRGVEWHQAQVAVNNQTAFYQFVIEGVRGGTRGDIAIDDISLMVSCPPRENQTIKPTSVDTNGSKKATTTFTVSTTPAILPSPTIYWSEDKGTDDFSKIIMIATTLGFSAFLNIVLIVLWIKYKRLKRASKLSTPVNIPLETNETSLEPLAVDEEACHETVTRVDGKFYDDFGTSGSESEDPSAEGLYNEHQGPRNEIVASVHREFYDDVDTNANASEEISSEGRTSDHEEVEVPSNTHQASGNTELNKRPDTLKRGTTGDGDYQALSKKVDIIDTYVIPDPEESRHETPSQIETFEEPKLSLENPVYTDLGENRVQGRNTAEDGSYQKLVKRDSDCVIAVYERRQSYEDIKMGGNLPAGYEKLDLSKP